MAFWSKSANPPAAAGASPASRTPAERRRRNDEIRGADRRTAAWLRSGGLAPRRDR
ncbi:hypothetical protein [Kitasatospora purpeofusca]|uniref:hypothetical protein n=1 Tax=Kitasatospora purpeofusca TaxID=67352 RepID=UPI00224C8CC4|nr:hypothetical protein [Kitasatospora purpeofusca]MCX4752913.1 hypothetical protein [Kitasatospora purpeofusca]WSR32456.1 hypothetical protein OG715_16570 [Kitasatospora purpeofusca]WSR40544.1 hypothetical protein OG196_16355 [Kitasatospora purpeofusca]